MYDGGYTYQYCTINKKISMIPTSFLITGGHISPAVSVVQELQKRGITHIHVVGRKYAFDEARNAESLEYQTVTGMGLPFTHLSAPRLNMNNPASFVSYLFKLIPSIVHAVYILARVKPDVVITFGGYVSVPVCLAAFMLRIPFIIHEQTTRPGRANMLLSRMARYVCVSWKETAGMFPKGVSEKIVLTGNPVRPEVLKHADRKAGQPAVPLLFITGGSTGAHKINRIVADALPHLLKKYSIIHQCGDSQYNDFDYLCTCRAKLPENLRGRYSLSKYLDGADMQSAMKRATIIIGRSGANTIVEVALTGKPMICIPLSIASRDEQMYNARKLASYGSAIILEQIGLTAKTLVDTVDDMAASYKTYETNAHTASKAEEFAIHPKAAGALAHIALGSIGNRFRVRPTVS